MTDTEIARRKAICDVAGVNDIGEVSDGFHTFNGLYEQRMILFAALVKAYKSKAWKSQRHEDGEYCFGGGWFVVGIDTPEGNYTYHYEKKYWDMFDCIDLPRAPHWDGHTEADAETRLMSLDPEIKTDWDTISEHDVADKLIRLINEFEMILSDIREKEVDDSVCGLCEYDADHGIDGYANECPGYEKDDCFRLKDEYRKQWMSMEC